MDTVWKLKISEVRRGKNHHFQVRDRYLMHLKPASFHPIECLIVLTTKKYGICGLNTLKTVTGPPVFTEFMGSDNI